MRSCTIVRHMPYRILLPRAMLQCYQDTHLERRRHPSRTSVKNLESDVTSEVTLMSLLTEVTQSLTWSRWKDIQTHLTSLHVWPGKSLIHFMDHRGSANHLSHVSQTETNGDQSVSVRVFLISCRMIHIELCWNDAGKPQKRKNLPLVTVTICTIRPGRRCPWVLPGLDPTLRDFLLGKIFDSTSQSSKLDSERGPILQDLDAHFPHCKK